MKHQPLNNYLRSTRRRSGLSQADVARLLGFSSRDTICRHETFTRTPTVPKVFAYELIFQASAAVLFAGIYEEVRRGVTHRAREFIAALSKSASPDAAQKIKFLEAVVEAINQRCGRE